MVVTITYEIIESWNAETQQTLLRIIGPATSRAGGHQIYVSAQGVATAEELLDRYQNIANQVENSYAEREELAAMMAGN